MTTRDLLATLFEAWETHDALRSAACFAPNGVFHEAGGQDIVGRDAIEATFAHFFRAGPPWRLRVDDVIVDGDRAAVAYRFEVKGDGPGWRERAGCAVVRFEDGLVAVWHEYQG